MKRFIAATLAAGCLVSSTPVFSADAADAGAFDKWLSPDAPECVPVSAIAKLTPVTPKSAARKIARNRERASAVSFSGSAVYSIPNFSVKSCPISSFDR